MKHLLFIIIYLLICFISLCFCFSKFDDDDYSEFNTDPHLDIQRNAKIKIPLPTSHSADHHHFNFNSDHFKDEIFKKDHLKFDPFKEDTFKRDPFKEDEFKRDPFKENTFKNDYFMKNDIKLSDEFKSDIQKQDHQPPKTENFKSKIIVLKKKEPKQNDAFNKSDSFVNEFNTNFNSNFDDFGRISDFDFHSHDPWLDHKDFDIPRHDRVTDEKLIHDYRQPTPRTPFRLPVPVVSLFRLKILKS